MYAEKTLAPQGKPSAHPPGTHKEVISIPLRRSPPVAIVDDPYSDRIKCEHPMTHHGAQLGAALLRAAGARGRGRVVARVMPSARVGLEMVGFRTEGIIPGYFMGKTDCAVMGAYLDEDRGELVHPKEHAQVLDLMDVDVNDGSPNGGAARPTAAKKPNATARPTVATRRAHEADAPAIASLLAETFPAYPTPSHEPTYVAAAIRDGVPFRLVELDQRIAACASADLVPEARTAELTDCATRPEYRGRGLMKALLDDLMEDLRALNYPTAFTLARARNPGVNLAFKRLGFAYRGTMPSSCRISTGLEDMNILSRRL